MNVFGYGRGSLSKAAEQALTKWCAEHGESPQPNVPVTEDKRVETEVRINPDERQPVAQEQASIKGASKPTQP